MKDLDQIYLFHLDKTFKQFKKRKNQLFKEAKIDLTSDQWVLIKLISENEGINQTELAKTAFKEPASVTRTLDILVRKGWVKRKTDEQNRRAFELMTTAEGRRMIDKTLPLAVEIRQKGMEGLSEKEVALLVRMLKIVYENFKN